MDYSSLFEPIKINKLEVKNRIFVPPMGTSGCSDKGEITEGVVKYFENVARGGAGLITSEVADVEATRRYNTNVMGAFNDSLIPGWKALVDAVHKYDAKLFAQLIHAGPIPLHGGDDQLGPVGPSPIPHIYNRNKIPHSLKKEEMEQIKQYYVDAARRVKIAGCDGVEIHMAHNHGLLGAFISPLSNKRVDEYGGDILGLVKYPAEVVQAVRQEVGPDYPIAVRLSCSNKEEGGLTIKDTVLISKVLEEASVDFIHASTGSLLDFSYIQPVHGWDKAINADDSQKIKEAVNIPVGVVGKIADPWVAKEVIESGKADAVYMGRAIICDHDLPNKIKNNQIEDIRGCIGCNECVTSAAAGGYAHCTLNPLFGHEFEFEPEVSKATEIKNVLIIGGGPGGLEAARVAALRGHKVTIFEKSDQLGGQYTIASYPPAKQELTKGLKYWLRQIDILGVTVELNKTATKENVEAFGADAVIVATGGKPVLPNWLVNGEHKNVVSAWDTLRGVDHIGQNILVVGGGLVGCEVADFVAEPHNYLKQFSRTVTVIEMADYLIVDDFSANRDMFVKRLMQKDVNILTKAKVEEVHSDGVSYSVNGETHKLRNIDTIISAIGTESENSLVEELSTLSIPIVTIGDAKAPRKIMDATYEGAKAG